MSKQKGRILYPFKPENDTQIHVEVGDVVFIIDSGSDGWTEVVRQWDMKKG
jgi:hypothetical protein